MAAVLIVQSVDTCIDYCMWPDTGPTRVPTIWLPLVNAAYDYRNSYDNLITMSMISSRLAVPCGRPLAVLRNLRVCRNLLCSAALTRNCTVLYILQ